MDKLLEQIQREMAEMAHQALLRPTDATAFEYGKVSGKYQGLQRAVEIIQNFTREIEDEESSS